MTEKNAEVISPTNHSAMNQLDFLIMTCYLLKEREKSRLQGEISFGFASHWWLNCQWGIIEPITERSNHNRVISLESHLKIALVHYTYTQKQADGARRSC